MAKADNLLHRNLLESFPFGNSLTAALLHQRISETLADDPNNDLAVSVVIRAFNEAIKLEQLLEDVRNQIFGGEVEVIVVDNGSTDSTPQVGKYYGAEVVTLPQKDFSYPKALNLGMETANNDLVFLTVAHARLSSIYGLHAGARHFGRNDDVAGAFGAGLPSESASYIERWFATTIGNAVLARRARRITKAGMGVLSATGAMIAKPVWQELGRFDERYQAGGDDTALAKLMLKNGYGVVYEPALTVHHSHGLGLTDSVKQLRHFQKVARAPLQFDRQRVLRHRPDLQARFESQ